MKFSRNEVNPPCAQAELWLMPARVVTMRGEHALSIFCFLVCILGTCTEHFLISYFSLKGELRLSFSTVVTVALAAAGKQEYVLL